MRLPRFTKSILLAAFFAANAFSAPNTDRVKAHSYASGNVTTSAYTTLIASTAVAAGSLEVCDTSTKLLKLAVGADGVEVDFMTAGPSNCVVVRSYIAPGSRISIKAIDATASTGYNLLSLLP